MKDIYRLQPTYPVNQITADIWMNPKPPTLYAIMNSIANYDSEEKTKIRNLALSTRESLFDFYYPLSNKVNKEQFECQILNHYIMRRIGFETVTAFQIYLENKLNEIMPYYNILFDSLVDYNLFNDGEVITRNRTDNGTTSLNTSNTINNSNEMKTKFSEYPLNQLDDIDKDSYVSNQTVNNGTSTNSGTSTNNGTSSNTSIETETRSNLDKMTLYKTYLESEKNKIMTMIYKDLDILFYGIGD